MVESAELRNREHENKTGGNWGEKGRLSPFLFLFPAPPTFRVPLSLASSPLSENLEQTVFCGVRDEPLRTSAWEATEMVQIHRFHWD